MVRWQMVVQFRGPARASANKITNIASLQYRIPGHPSLIASLSTYPYLPNLNQKGHKGTIWIHMGP